MGPYLPIRIIGAPLVLAVLDRLMTPRRVRASSEPAKLKPSY